MDTLVGFLKTGQLGGLRTGMPCEDVRRLLGEPEDTCDHDPPMVWRYGSLQLAFGVRASPRSGERPEWHLDSIRLYFHEPEFRLPAGIPLLDPLPDNMSFQEFRAYLDTNQVPIVGGITTGPDKRLVFDSGVRATFDEDRLYNVAYYAKHEPELKQLTVKVTRSDFELIKQWAKGRHISASDLCSEWVKEFVSRTAQGREAS